MLYEEYRRKILKIANIKRILRRFRALIIAAAALAAALTAVFFGVRGIVYDCSAGSESVYYGEVPGYSAKALFKRVSYQYAAADSDEWTQELPRGIGKYKVRGVSSRTFGAPSYSEEYVFSVLPKPIEVKVDPASAVYGDALSVSAAVAEGDRIECSAFEYADPSQKTTSVSPVATAVAVYDAQGKDVTKCYAIRAAACEVTFSPRPIAVEVASAQHVYDGRPFASEAYEIKGGLARGDTLQATFARSLTEVGEIPNEPQLKIVNETGADVTDNYAVDLKIGNLKVLKRPVNVGVSGAEKPYDGTPLSCAEYALDPQTPLAEGHTLSLLSRACRTDAGESENELAFSVTGADGRDATGNYQFSFPDRGMLKVTPRPVVVRTGGASKIYDGIPLACEEYELVSEGALLDGHTLQAKASGMQTLAGVGENTLSKAKVTAADGTDVTKNYEIVCECGRLEVFPRPITVRTGSRAWIYDGKPHADTRCEVVSANGAVNGHTLRAADPPARITDCGAAENIFEVRVFDGSADVTYCYEIEYEYGALTVTPRPVTVRAGDIEKIYDGTPLTGEGYAVVSALKLAEGHIGKLLCEGSQTDAGSSENRAVSFSVLDGDRDVTKNYEISLQSGVLSVLPRPLSVKTADGQWTYDGERHYDAAYALAAESSLAEGHSLSVGEYAEIENAGETPNFVSLRVYDGAKDVTHNYLIEYACGTLKVLPRPISVKTAGGEWMYDGKGHAAPEYGLSSALSPALVKGHVPSLAEFSTAEDAGETKNKLAVLILDGERDVTDNYKISYEYGVLKILPRPIRAETGNQEWIYDGKAHSHAQWSISSALSPALAEGQEEKIAQEKFVTDAGEYPNALKLGVFAGGRDVTKNYEIAYTYGTLAVLPRPITVTTDSGEKIYDGLPLTFESFTVTSELSPALAEGQFAVAGFSGAQTDAGASANTISQFWVFDEEWDQSKNLAKNYEIIYIYGTLTVFPRPITVTTGSSEKIYDGTPLTDGTYAITSELTFALVTGHRARVMNAGAQTDAGSSENRVGSFAVFDGGRDVTANYSTTYVAGTLTVLKRPITVRAEDARKTYDGAPLTHFVYKVVSEYRLVYGHRLSVAGEGAQTEAGFCDNKILSVAVYSGDRDVTANYEIATENGVLTVDPVALQCFSDSAEKPYDGTPLTAAGWALIDGGTLQGHVLTIYGTCGSILYPGSCYNELDYTVVETATGRDVSHNYRFNKYDLGTLTVLPVEITVRTGSAQKIYDGEPLTCGDWTLLDGEFYEGYTTEVNVYGWIKWVGSTRNRGYVAAYTPEGESAPIYKVTWIYGILTVLPNPDIPGHGFDPNPGSGGGGGGSGDGDIYISESGQIAKNPSGIGGGSDGGKMVTAFKATADTDGTVYFRIKSFGDYWIEFGWLDAESYVGSVNPLYFSSAALQNAGMEYSAVEVERVLQSLPYLVPYYSSEGSFWGGDDTQMTGSWSSAFHSYIPYEYSSGRNISLAGTEYEASERTYSRFVHDYYLQLPASTKNTLQAVAEKNMLDAKDPAIVEQVARLVKKTVDYDLDFEEYEEDFAVYFFTKAKTGICQHYATAATAMYRALGIPARYVTGFVGDVQAGKTVSVTTKQAHAWVEVYLDGMGWVQVEVTGEGFFRGGEGEAAGDDFEESFGSFTVKPVDVDKEYDGTPLYAENKVEGLVFEELLAMGYTYEATVSGWRTDYGESESVITHFVIYDPQGNDVTDKFSFKLEKGSILVTKPQIHVRVYSLQKYYDGTPLSYESDDYSVVKIPERHTLRLELKGSLTDAGRLSLRSLSKLPVTVYDGKGNDVTADYYVKFIGEPLRVDRRAIEITGVSKVKEYDGAPLKGDSAWISKGSLAAGHTIEIELSAFLIDVGSTENTIGSVKILDAEGKNVANNYRITKRSGMLTVEAPR